MGCQAGKMSRLPLPLAQWFTPEPGDHPDHSHGRRRQELLEVCARQAQISTLAEIKASDPLRQATLHPGSQRILRFELRRLLALPRYLERLMVGLGADCQLARSRLGGGARLTGGTHATGGPVKPDAHDRVARHIVPRPPVDAGMPLGTVRLLGLPSDDKGLEVIACPLSLLSAVGPKRRTHHIDLMVRLGGNQEVRIDIPAVQQVRAWEDITIG